MHDGTEFGNSSRWHHDPRVVSALITSAFGLIGTMATIFAVRHHSEQAAAPTAEVHTSTASMGIPSGIPPTEIIHGNLERPTDAPPPNLLLNFAAFQSRLAKPDVDPEERNRIVHPLIRHRVVWRGFVDSITPMSSPTPEMAITVSLVESENKLGQSMFKTPAHFRFGQDALETIAQLREGDLVTISGTLTDHSLIATNLVDAHLMTINGLPLNRVIASPEQKSSR